MLSHNRLRLSPPPGQCNAFSIATYASGAIKSLDSPGRRPPKEPDRPSAVANPTRSRPASGSRAGLPGMSAKSKSSGTITSPAGAAARR